MSVERFTQNSIECIDHMLWELKDVILFNPYPADPFFDISSCRQHAQKLLSLIFAVHRQV